MLRNRSVSLALVGLFAWVTACTSYTQIEPSEVADYGEVRVTFADGERIVLREATVEVEAAGASTGSTVVAVLVGTIVVATLICAAACEFPLQD